MYAIVDIETTGGNPRLEKITEIAIVFFDGVSITDKFVTLINPERNIPEFITSLTGINNEMVENAPKFYEVAKNIIELTTNKIFIAHNVNFDYHFIQQEFKELGFDFERKKLCTVRLSRKLIPGLKSYSLGNLCEELGIENSQRHRAEGDALATTRLFEILLSIDNQSKPIIREIVENSFKDLHPKLKKEVIDKLPEKTGVYYFYDEEGRIIYVGKSKNIRNRIYSHLNNNESVKSREMKSNITDIGFELTGNELIALLLESDEIKKHKPLYNRAQRRSAFVFGLYYYYHDDGYIRLAIDKNSKPSAKYEKEIPLTSFTSLQSAKSYMFYLVEKYTLCQKLCGLYDSVGGCFQRELGLCKGACLQLEPPDEYNSRVEEAISDFSYLNENFIIIDKGRDTNEKSVVYIANGKYMGFGFFEPDSVGNDIEGILDSVKPYNDNRDVQHIIRSFMQNKKVEKIIRLD